MMTQAAQAALRRVIEQYTRNVRFCIICNYVNKITPAIQSRCTRFRFSPLPISEVEKRVDAVVEAERYALPLGRCSRLTVCRVNLTQDGKEALLKLSRGDMRRALNVLQACHAAYPRVDEEAIYVCTGNPHPKDIDNVVSSMMSEEFGTCYTSTLHYILFIRHLSGLTSISDHFVEDRTRVGVARFNHWRLRSYSRTRAPPSISGIYPRPACIDRVSSFCSPVTLGGPSLLTSVQGIAFRPEGQRSCS